MARTWSMPIDVNNPEDRRVAKWLIAQSDPATAVKKLILKAEERKDSPARLLEMVPSILKEVQALRAELNQVRAGQRSARASEEILYELRALRADLARTGPKDLGQVAPPPEDPESARRLDSLFGR
jgi:hypothetical protein